MRIEHIYRPPAQRKVEGTTLAEVIIAMAVAGIFAAATIGGYVFSLRAAESTSYSVAANALALQRFEQVRSTKWDAVTYPAVDQMVSSNFPPQELVLDLPGSGTNLVYATNFTTITTVSTNPLIKMIRVECVYTSLNSRLVTNLIVSYRAPDTGQQNILPFTPPTSPTLPPNSGTTTRSNTRGSSTGNDDDDDDDDD